MGRPGRRRIALPDTRLIGDHGEGGALQQVVQSQVAAERCTQGGRVGQRIADIEDDGRGAIGIYYAAGEQGDGLGRPVLADGQGGGARYQALAIAQPVGHQEAALAEEGLAEGEVVG